MLITLCYVVLQRVLQLVALRFRSIEYKELEIVVLRHELAVLGRQDPIYEPYRVTHYNRGRPHASLGPGIPDVPCDELEQPSNGHRIANGHHIVAVPILAGLHHEYWLEPEACPSPKRAR